MKAFFFLINRTPCSCKSDNHLRQLHQHLKPHTKKYSPLKCGHIKLFEHHFGNPPGITEFSYEQQLNHQYDIYHTFYSTKKVWGRRVTSADGTITRHTQRRSIRKSKEKVFFLFHGKDHLTVHHNLPTRLGEWYVSTAHTRCKVDHGVQVLVEVPLDTKETCINHMATAAADSLLRKHYTQCGSVSFFSDDSFDKEREEHCLILFTWQNRPGKAAWQNAALLKSKGRKPTVSSNLVCFFYQRLKLPSEYNKMWRVARCMLL